MRERKELSYKKWAKRLTKYYSLMEKYFNPDLIVIGGGVSRQSDKFVPFIDIKTPIVRRSCATRPASSVPPTTPAPSSAECTGADTGRSDVRHPFCCIHVPARRMTHGRDGVPGVRVRLILSRVDISAPGQPHSRRHFRAIAGRGMHRSGKLNDSNPTRHGLAPALVPSTYYRRPERPAAAREALASFLNRASPGRLQAPARAGGGSGYACICCSSTSEAYSWLMKLLCDAGDAVLAPKPGYPLIESIARLECVDTIEYQLHFDGSWYIDVAEFARCWTARRRTYTRFGAHQPQQSDRFVRQTGGARGARRPVP